MKAQFLRHSENCTSAKIGGWSYMITPFMGNVFAIDVCGCVAVPAPAQFLPFRYRRRLVYLGDLRLMFKRPFRLYFGVLHNVRRVRPFIAAARATTKFNELAIRGIPLRRKKPVSRTR